MKLFGQIIRTAVNVATLPLAVAADAMTLGAQAGTDDGLYTNRIIEKLKREADEK